MAPRKKRLPNKNDGGVLGVPYSAVAFGVVVVACAVIGSTTVQKTQMASKQVLVKLLQFNELRAKVTLNEH